MLRDQSKPTGVTTPVSFRCDAFPFSWTFLSALEDLFARMGITTEHARTTATSFMWMLVAVENTSATAPGGSGRYEVFFAPEDDFCGLSDDGDSSFKFLEDESPDLVNSPAATTAVASTGDLYSSPLALTSSSNTLIASSSPALLPSSLPPANTMVAVVAYTGSSAAPPAVALAGTTTALPATPVAPVVAPALPSNTTTVTPVRVTASTAALYALPFVQPANAPLNAIPPPTHLITPIYGYHVPAPNASGPFYTVTRGRDIGIFASW